LETAGVPRHRFLDTRHTAVSTLTAHGVSMKVLQELVGHSLLSTTADIDGHLTSAAFNEAASILDAAYETTKSA
jgi:integrase